MAPTRFTEQIAAAERANDSLLCIGLDPDAAKFPAGLKGDARRIFDFCAAIVDATKDLAIAFKPQIAYFAAQRAEDQLEALIAHIHAVAPAVPVILDAKRGDIGSTAEQYAREAFERYRADALTLSPWMGLDSIEPYMAYEGKGLILLCRTSNPGGADLQALRLPGGPGDGGDPPGEALFERVARLAAGAWNTGGQLGLVVGATFPADIERVRALAPTLPLLIPGLGAQGGDAAATVRAGYRSEGGRVTAPILVSSSRAVLYAGPGEDFAAAARVAALAARRQLNAARRPAERRGVRVASTEPAPQPTAPAAAAGGASPRPPQAADDDGRPAGAPAVGDADPESAADASSMLRLVCGVGAAACALTALSLRLQAPPQAVDDRTVGTLVGACLLSALAFGGAAWRIDALASAQQRALLRLLACLCAGLVGGVALGTGEGVRSIELGFFGLLVCLSGVLLGRLDAIAMALAGAVTVAALALAEGSGWLMAPGGPAAAAVASTGRAAATQLLLIGCGLGVGLTMAAAAAGAARRVAEREQRFRVLLDIAADIYWELDADLRLTRLGRIEPGRPGVWQPPSSGGPIGKVPFDTLAEPARSAHVADLQARRPFTNLHTVQHDPNGGTVHLSISGRPRFAADGRFLGYWGVSRDITHETRSQSAVAASEARYRDLFERAPSPLVLHRDGRVLAANPAGAALLGFPVDGEDIVGFALERLLEDEALRRQFTQRLTTIATLPVGGSLPVRDYAVRAVDGRRLTVQVSSVQVDTADGPAALSIFVDITERAAAVAALCESRNTLAALFANSPDGMALTLVETGRYVMVNDSCARMLGYRVDELIGRTSVELGIWHHPAERARLVDALAADGRVPEMPSVFNTRSGGTISLTVSAARIELDGRAHLLATLRDVSQTEQLRLEHAAVFRGAIVGIALLREQRFQLANPRFEDIFGWPRGTLKGEPSAVVWPDAEQYAADRRGFRPLLLEGRPITIERPMRRADGSTFWCRLQAQAVDPGNPLDSGTVWIGEDITERRQLDAQLAAARDEALEGSRAKSAFLANTSHEIRTPLNGLIGLAQLAAADDLAPALRQQYLGHIVASARGLAAIISDILDLSKIEAGQLSVDRAPLALRDLLQVLHGTYRPQAAARGLRLRVAVDPAVPAWVLGDAMRLRQILDNYLTNALKFTARGEICIRARPAGAAGRLRLSVTDSGPGIGAELRQRLFTPFTQGDDSTTRRHGGTGLGLSICRQLAGLLDGTVGVDSEPGRGSEFWVELPLAADDATPTTLAGPVAATAEDRPAADRRDGSPGVMSAVAMRDELADMRVLVVEDNPVNMLIVTAMLARWGAEAVEAADGSQAIDAVSTAVREGRPFDAVLMDVQMPEMSGHEATSRLRRDFDAQELPIIALTAAALVDEREKARAAGMNEFLTKPIDAGRLFETLRRYGPQAVETVEPA